MKVDQYNFFFLIFYLSTFSFLIFNFILTEKVVIGEQLYVNGENNKNLEGKAILICILFLIGFVVLHFVSENIWKENGRKLKMKNKRLGKEITEGLTFGLFAGIFYGLAIGVIYVLVYGIVAGLIAGLIAGLVTGFVYTFFVWGSKKENEN